MEPKEYWNKRVEQINDLRKLLNDKPDEYKIGYSLSYGGILNAYREGDISFEEAKQKLADIKANPLEPMVMKKNGGQLALITKKRTPDIIIMSKDEKDFEQAIDTMYWNKRGLKPVEWTKEEMLKDYKKVKIYIEEIG